MRERAPRPTGSSSSSEVPARSDGGAGGFDLDGFLDPIAAGGMAGASSALPHGDAIQRSFGRHDVGGVTAAVGGAGGEASRAMGASGYAMGSSVAFAEQPDLHLAAHEAAHVVQQRGGVQLHGGVGRSGDAYEQHADRVADHVVRGESAEATLDEMAGGGSATTAIQRHDSPGHVAIGNSVAGPSVFIHEIEFTPGEISALTDYIGEITSPAAVEKRFTKIQVDTMKYLLLKGIEDVMPWDKATGGAYSIEAQLNEKHFAPAEGDGGANFRDRFIDVYARALFATSQGFDPIGAIGDLFGHGQPRDDPQTLMYSAEHYLQDAFSAGHHVAALDIEAQVHEVLAEGEASEMGREIGNRVFDRVGPTITANYGITEPLTGHPLAMGRGDFVAIARAGAFMKDRDGVTDAVRRFVHERLAGTTLVATSKAHPEPFQLLGDHDLATPAAAESVQALQLAMYEARELLKRGATVADPDAEATRLFDHHCPVPYLEDNDLIRDILASSTADRAALTTAVVDTMCDTITEALDAVVLMSHGNVVRLTDASGTKKPIKKIDAFVPPEEEAESAELGADGLEAR